MRDPVPRRRRLALSFDDLNMEVLVDTANKLATLMAVPEGRITATTTSQRSENADEQNQQGEGHQHEVGEGDFDDGKG